MTGERIAWSGPDSLTGSVLPNSVSRAERCHVTFGSGWQCLNIFLVVEQSTACLVSTSVKAEGFGPNPSGDLGLPLNW